MSMRVRVYNSGLWLFIIVACVLFIPFNWFSNRELLFEVLNAAIMAVAAGVAVGFWPRGWSAIRLPPRRLDAADLLIIGIVVCSLGCVAIFGGQWLWRAMGKPDWVVDGFPLAFARWWFLLGAILVLVSSATKVNGVVTPMMFRRSCIVVAMALVAAFALSYFGLDNGYDRSNPAG